jgi:hypothetical protein
VELAQPSVGGGAMSIDHEVYRKAKEKEEQGQPLTAEEIAAIYMHEQEVLCDLCRKSK